MSHGRGKSDCCVVPKKLPNKAAGASPAAAEAVEGRRQVKGNAFAARMSRRSVRPYDMGTALDGRLWHRALCRRSQRHYLPWRRMRGLLARWLPVAHICHPYPNQRLIVTTQGKSRMR